jgi:hypothetical protein
MKSSTIMIILTAIIIAVALFGKHVNDKIQASATTILEDRLKPGPLLSHRFDYYGTYISSALSTSIINVDTLLTHKDEIMEVREQTGKEWKAYLSTYLVPEEDSVAKLSDKQMIDIDEKLDDIFKLAETDKIGAQKLLEQSNIKEELLSVTDRINWLTDLQSRIGQEETVKMLSLIRIFDNFMIGCLALAIMLSGSIFYSAIRDRKKAQPVKKTARRVTKKPIAKKKPIKKPIRR